MTELTGKFALITGGSKGIGRAIALAYGKLGITVALTYMGDKDSAHDVVLEIDADVRNEASIKAMVVTARDAFGQINILVHNAGITLAKPWQQVTTDDWNTIVATNLTSAFLTTQEIVPDMVTRGWGRVIILSSVAAQLGGVIGPHLRGIKGGPDWSRARLRVGTRKDRRHGQCYSAGAD